MKFMVEQNKKYIKIVFEGYIMFRENQLEMAAKYHKIIQKAIHEAQLKCCEFNIKHIELLVDGERTLFITEEEKKKMRKERCSKGKHLHGMIKNKITGNYKSGKCIYCDKKPKK